MGRRKRKNAGEVMDSTGSLPDDALLVIFSHISTRDLLSRMALVCKRWLRLVKSHSVKELLPSVLCRYDCPWGSLREEDFLELWSCYCSCLEKVSLNGIYWYWQKKYLEKSISVGGIRLQLHHGGDMNRNCGHLLS